MAEINKLSVEKTLEKLRRNDLEKSTGAKLDEKTEVLDEEIKRMNAIRLGWRGCSHSRRYSCIAAASGRGLLCG